MPGSSKHASRTKKVASLGLAILLASTGLVSQDSSGQYTFHSETELVLVNVTARDQGWKSSQRLETRRLYRIGR